MNRSTQHHPPRHRKAPPCLCKATHTSRAGDRIAVDARGWEPKPDPRHRHGPALRLKGVHVGRDDETRATAVPQGGDSTFGWLPATAAPVHRPQQRRDATRLVFAEFGTGGDAYCSYVSTFSSPPANPLFRIWSTDRDDGCRFREAQRNCVGPSEAATAPRTRTTSPSRSHRSSPRLSSLGTDGALFRKARRGRITPRRRRIRWT